MAPNYISKEGVWYAAKEKTGLVNRSGKTIVVEDKEVKDGEPYIYEGPDRAALLEFHKENVENFGQEFRNNPEFLAGIRNQGFNTVDDYLKAIGYKQEESDKVFKEKAVKITKHELPKKVKAVETLGGGRDFAASGKDRYGGFGLPEEKS